MASKFQFITELYRSTLAGLTDSHESWTGFLRSACYNYKCPFDEQVLIYAQRPNATAVLELEKWNRQFGRWVNAGAAGIAVIAESRGKGRLKHYFDITDTHATPVSRPVPIWSMTPAYAGQVIETLEATFGVLSEKDTLQDAVRSASRNAVADNFQDYLRDLRDCRDGSMLEELDELNVEVAYRRALESSVAYMLMTRLSLSAPAYILPEDFADIYSFDTPSTINALGIATSDIAEMGLREISRTVMQAQREQFFAKDTQIGYDAVKEQNHIEKERSGDHGSDLSDAGGLSPAQPDAAAGAVGASGQVRGAAEAVPEAASPGAVYQSQDQRPAGGASGGDRGDGAADGDADRGPDGTGGGRNGGAEGRRSPALDGADEQPPAQRGGDGAERSDLQLTAKAGSDERPAIADHSGEYALLDRLRADCDYFLGAGARNEKHLWAGSVYAQIKKMREVYAALPEKPEWLTTDAIDRYAAQMAAPYRVTTYHHFENGFDDKLDYQTLAEAEAAAQGYVDGTMDEDGFAYDGAAVYNLDTRQHLRIYGNYPDEKAQEQAAAFAQAQDGLADDAALPAFLDTHLIEANLLDDGGRKHKRQEIFQYFQAHKSLAERTEFLKGSYNDIWVEVLTDGVRTGYHAEQDGLLMWEGSYLSRTAESVFSWGVVTEMTESLIERGAYKIRLGLQDVPVMAEQMSFFGMADNTAVYEVPEEQRAGELFPVRQVPQEVIDQALYTAGNSYGSAERIAVFYMRQWPEADCTAFLRREFGTDNGRGIEHEGRKYAVWFMEDGIHLAQGSSVRTGYSKTVVTWEQASARILELLEAGTYLSAAELERARELVLLEMGDALLMTARDLSEEGRAAGFFPKTREIHDQHKGYANNVAAIRLLKRLEAEGRAAVPEEQEVLAKYVGWGGLADCFDPKHSRYAELKSLLTDTEYAAARESTLTAFYTPPVVIRSIYAALEQMGFSQGNLLEPSCGVGSFLGMLPDSMADSKIYGVELDNISGRIARQLYPCGSISVRGYEKTDFPDNFFDAAVGNVPFGQFKVQDRRYDRLNLPVHEYFFTKTLDKVRPGGVVAFVTSSYTMDKRTSNVRKYIAQRAELLGAIRLPNDTFKAAAGTEVVSDILFLQKRDRMVDIEPDWVQLGTTNDGIQMNRYFIDHPDMVLGEMKMVSGPYGPEPTCAPFPDQTLDSLLANAVQNIHGEITAYEREEELEGEDLSIAADPAVRNFSYTLVDGKLYYRENSRMNPVEVSKTAESRIRGMIGLRDCVRTLLEYQTED